MSKYIDVELYEKLYNEYYKKYSGDAIYAQDEALEEVKLEANDYEKQIDRIMKINMWILEKYGKKLLKDFSIPKTDMTVEYFDKCKKMFDKIYEDQNEKTPKMWYEYGLNGDKN